MMQEIEKELIFSVKRDIIEDFEPTEKKPRIFKAKKKTFKSSKKLQKTSRGYKTRPLENKKRKSLLKLQKEMQIETSENSLTIF